MAKARHAHELISGRLKRSASYASELAGLTVEQLEEIVREGSGASDKAKKMLKLIKQAERLRKKLRDAGS